MVSKPVHRGHNDRHAKIVIEHRNENGDFHRVHGPAEVRENGTEAWWLNGIRHRADGPAVSNPNGYAEWRLHGIRHRLDGPAMIKVNIVDPLEPPELLYFVDGKEFSKESFDNIVFWLKCHDIEYPFSDYDRQRFDERWLKECPIMKSKRDKEWRKNGVLHRLDGPAMVNKGELTWYKNGLKHRADGPAVIRRSGTKEWWLNGLRHRENGPAFEFPPQSNKEIWYLYGKKHRMDGAAITAAHNTLEWWISGTLIARQQDYGRKGAIDRFESVVDWIKENNIKFPLSDEEQLVFDLRWL